tara:strand:+ start:164 stop:355 length:192 start_codon:yes stop_codon:yes gene_type:complete
LEIIAFTSNADAANTLIFGKDIQTWLVYTLIFFGITSFSFVWVWFAGLLKDRQSGKPLDKFWE